MPWRRSLGSEAGGLFRRQVDGQHTIHAGGGGGIGKRRIAHDLDRIQIAHQHHRRGGILRTELAHHGQHVGQAGVMDQCPLVRLGDHRAVSHGIGNGTPSSMTSAPAATMACISGTVTARTGSPAVT